MILCVLIEVASGLVCIDPGSLACRRMCWPLHHPRLWSRVSAICFYRLQPFFAWTLAFFVSCRLRKV